MTALRFEIHGPADAPPLLLSGSLGTDLSMWGPQLPLADRFRLILIDNRGHGASPKPPGPYTIAELAGDVIELLDALGIERTGFAGVSIGGMIGLSLAIDAPERLTGLVCICSAAYMPNADAFTERAALVRSLGSTASIADAVVAKWLTPAFADAHPDLRDRLVAMVCACDPEGYASCAEAVGAFDVRAQLAAIAVPTLVLSGAQDAALPPPCQQEIASGIPGAQLRTLDPGAHIVSIEQAAAVNELIGVHLR